MPKAITLDGEVVSIDRLPITTMTSLATLTHSIDISTVFKLLPLISREEFDIAFEAQKGNPKIASLDKLPHCSPGSIIDVRDQKGHRGWHPKPTKPFKNTFTFDYSTDTKNISVKITPISIHTCGVKSMSEEIKNVDSILEVINRAVIFQRNMIHYEDEFDRVIQMTKGEKIECKVTSASCSGNDVIIIEDIKDDHEIVFPPKDSLNEVERYLVSLCYDFKFHSQLVSYLDELLQLKPVLVKRLELPSGVENAESIDEEENEDEILKCVMTEEVMVNYNYSLGFSINRTKLALLIDGEKGFVARFINTIDNRVSIELPYAPPKITFVKRKPNKVSHHTFLVYRTGSVTQSSPGREAANAYHMFMSFINSVKDMIMANK